MTLLYKPGSSWRPVWMLKTSQPDYLQGRELGLWWPGEGELWDQR